VGGLARSLFPPAPVGGDRTVTLGATAARALGSLNLHLHPTPLAAGVLTTSDTGSDGVGGVEEGKGGEGAPKRRRRYPLLSLPKGVGLPKPWGRKKQESGAKAVAEAVSANREGGMRLPWQARGGHIRSEVLIIGPSLLVIPFD
jgi:hypothetical protein